MTHAAEVIADSINMEGERITTLLLTIPKFVNAQLNTHGRLAKSAESSRARSIESVIEQVTCDPYIPPRWPTNGKGMVPSGELDEATAKWMLDSWLDERSLAVERARDRKRLGLHKEVVNRGLEQWMWQKVLVTATEWENFFAVRNHPHAQIDMQLIARAISDAMSESEPRWCDSDDPIDNMHLPFITDSERAEMRIGGRDLGIRYLYASANRCKRVSYGRQAVTKPITTEYAEGLELVRIGHMGPTEHPALPLPGGTSGPFVGWKQFRKTIPNEANPLR